MVPKYLPILKPTIADKYNVKTKKGKKGTYTRILFSGISAGISVKPDKNQHASHTNIARK